jgi:hypothetical protein
MALGDSPYKPFISGELAKQQTNLMASNKMMIEWANLLLKLVPTSNQGPNGPVININNQNQVQANTNYLTIERAIEMIGEEKGQMILDDDSHRALEGQYIDGHNLPEIIATNQEYEAQGGMLVKPKRIRKPDHHEDFREEGQDSNILSE